MNQALKESRAAMEKLLRNREVSSAYFGLVEIDALHPDELYRAQLALTHLGEHARMISAACNELGQALRVTGDTEEEVDLPGKVVYARSIGELLEPVERQADAIQRALADIINRIGYLRKEL
jgi:hypothetical protein